MNQKPPIDPLETTTDQERRKVFLRYINRAWLILGIVTLASLPIFPQNRNEFIFLAALIFPTYLIIRFLNLSGRIRLAGMVFTVVVNFGFYGLFMLLVRELGADKAFETETNIWLLMGLAVLFAGAFVDKWAAPALAALNSILLIGTRLTLAPDSIPRPSALVFWWMMALAIWFYEDTLHKALKRLWAEITERKQAEEIVRESEEKYRRLFDNANLGIFQSTPEGKAILVNDAFAHMFGYDSPEDAIKSIKNIATDIFADPNRRAEIMRLMAENPGLRTFENLYRRKDGSTFIGGLNTQLIKDADGSPIRIEGIVEDITERKQAEEALRASEDQLKESQIIANIGSYVLDFSIGLWKSSAVLDKLFGIDASYVRSVEGWSDLIHPDHRQQMTEYFANEVVGKHIRFDREYKIARKNDNTERWVHGLGELEFDTHNNLLKMHGTIQDITERKQAEKEVQESEARYRTLFEDSPVPLLEEDFSVVKRFIDTLRKNGVEDFRGYFSTHPEEAKQCASMVHIVDVNKTLLEWYGIKSKTEFKVNLDQVLLSNEYESFIEELLALMQGGDRYELSVSRHSRDGKFIHIIINGTIVPGYEESWGRILVSIVDITERKQAEDALRESEKRFRSLYDNATIGMYRTTPDGQIILSNPAGMRMLGYDSFEEIAKRNLEVEGFESDYDRSQFRRIIKRAGTVIGLESAWKRKDGSTIYVRESATTVKDNDGNVIYYDGTFEDITERKQAEAALRKSDQRLQVFFNQSLDGFFFCNFEEPEEWKNAKNKEQVLEYIITTQRYTDVNDAMLQQYGISREEFLSFTTKDVFAHDIEQGRKLRRELFDNGRLHLETYERTGHGTQVWFEGEYVCLYDEQERITGFFGIQRDITERKLAEQVQFALYGIANVAQTTLSLNDLFASIHKTLGTFMPAENFYIAIYDEQNELLSFPYFVDQYEDAPASQNLGNGLTEYVLRTRQSLLATPQVFKEMLNSKQVDLFGVASVDWMGVPLAVAGETFGVMVVQTYTDKVRLTQKDLEFLSFVSIQAAMVIKRKQTEEMLQQFRGLMDESNDAIFFIDLDTSRYIDFNKNALEHLGYTPDELHQLVVVDVADHVHNIEDWREQVALVNESNGLVFETNYRRKNGTIFPVEVSARISNYAGKTIMVAVVRNTTERKQAEEAVNQRLAEQTILHRASQSLLAVHLDPETIYTTLHQAVVQIMPCEVFNIVLDDKSDGDYHAVYLYDAGQRYPARRIPRGQGLSGKVISNGETLFIHDNLQENVPAVRFGSPRAVRSILAVPLRKNNESVGMVSAQSYEPNAYGERHRVLLETLAAQITTVIENARLFEAERKQRQMSDVLRDALSAGASMSASLDFESILDRLLEALERVVPFDGGAIMLVQPQKQKINIAKMRGYKMLEKQAADIILNFSFDIAGVENLRWVLNNKQPLVISDVTQYPGWVRVPESIFTRSWVGAPIIVNNEVIALFSLDSTEPNFFTNEHAELLRAFTGQASLALQNARLFDETTRRVQEFASLYETSNALSAENELNGMLQVIVEHAKKLLGSASSGIYLYLSETDELELTIDTMPYIPFGTRLKLNDGVAGRVAKTHQPLRVDDYSTWEGRSVLYDGAFIRAILEVPMLYGGELIGVLTADEVGDSERKFTEADERLLTLFASQAAGAIHSARLREQTVRRLDQLQALHTIDRAISSSFDLRPILNTVITQTIAQLGVDAVDVLLFHPHLQMLEYVAGQGFRTRAIERTQLRFGECFAGRAAIERRTIHIPNLPETGSNFARASILEGENFLEYYGVPLIAKGEVKGVLEVFHRASLPHNPEWLDFLETLAGQAAITIDQTQLFDDLQRANLELIIAYDATIEGWSHAMDLRDKETEGHTLRVTETTQTLAKAMGISDKEMLHIRRGALLHDIGKMGVPDNILLKEGALTDDEWVIMRQHPAFAYEMLRPIKYLQQSLDIPYCHHEKWDGTGYPRGLQGQQIPLVARIFSVIDVWDAVTIDRPYRKAWTKQKALKHIREQSEKHFDPEVVKAFLKLFDAK